MKNKGFILDASVWTDDPQDLDSVNLHIQDERCGVVSPDDETTSIVSVWLSENCCTLEFTRQEAKDLITAMGIIVDRYEITPEEWEAK